MTIKIKGIEMPQSCAECPFLVSEETTCTYKGMRIGGKCRVLPVRDLEGEEIGYQVIYKNANHIENYTKERSSLCPLVEDK